jgi:type I restriction enzyme, S subunit
MQPLSKWPEVELGAHSDLLPGFAFKSNRFTDNPNDIPLVKGANLHQGYIDWKSAKRWPISEFNEHNKFHLVADDIVLAMDRPWIDAGLKYSWIRPNEPKSLLVQRVARLRGINGLLSSYLRFVIGSREFTDYIKPIVTGVNVPHISGEQIKAFKFRLPPIDIQKRIVNILSAYDRLIENNTRRIKILEEMAQNLYREWFVNFRFPGHEQTKLVDSELGLVPECWDIGRLEDAVVLQRGFDLPKRDRKPGTVPIYASTGITDTHCEAKVKASGRLFRILCKRSKIPTTKETVLCQEQRKNPTAQMSY